MLKIFPSMPLLRKSFFIFLYLSFLVCFSLQTLSRNSSINFSSSGTPTYFVDIQHSYFQVTTLLPVSKKCDSLHVSPLLDQGLTNVTVPYPWQKDCTTYTSLFFEILRSTLNCTFIYCKLCLLLPVNSTHRNINTLHVIGNYFLLYLIYRKFCILLSLANKSMRFEGVRYEMRRFRLFN